MGKGGQHFREFNWLVKKSKSICGKEGSRVKKYAFLILSDRYVPEKHNVCFEESEDLHTYIFTVRSFEEAREKVLQLGKEGFGAIELCGAFGKERAEELVDLTGHRIAIGYVVNDSRLDEAFKKFFSKQKVRASGSSN